MGDVKGFLKVKKQAAKHRPVCERIKDYAEVMLFRSDNNTEQMMTRLPYAIMNGAVIPDAKLIDAKDKRVVVIGGGDTGADCLGVAHRQKAAGVIQIELLSRPAQCRTQSSPWPEYPFYKYVG